GVIAVAMARWTSRNGFREGGTFAAGLSSQPERSVPPTKNRSPLTEEEVGGRGDHGHFRCSGEAGRIFSHFPAPGPCRQRLFAVIIDTLEVPSDRFPPEKCCFGEECRSQGTGFLVALERGSLSIPAATRNFLTTGRE